MSIFQELPDLYPCKVEIIKYYLKGNLEGQKTADKTGFTSWSEAIDWCGRATMDVNCNYVVLELRNLETNEVENF